MNRTKTISRILAGVSAVALTATMGVSLARAAGSTYDSGPYASITQALSTDFIVVDAHVDGDVSINAGVDVGPNDTAIDILGDTIVNGALHNDGSVYATDDELAIGINVDGEALLHDGIENDGMVRAWATGTEGGEVDAVGISYDVFHGDHSHSMIDNSATGEIHARTRVTGDNASAGSVGVAQDVNGIIAEADLNNDHWITSLADASSADIYDANVFAEATAAGAMQDVYSEDLSAIADIDNQGTIDARAEADTSSFEGDSLATAVVAGVAQEVNSGFHGTAEVDNAEGARIDVNGHATASAGYTGEDPNEMGDGSAIAAAGGAGIFQFVHGHMGQDGADESVADIWNSGAVSVSLSASADAYGSDIAAYATAAGAGALQVAFTADGEDPSSLADSYNEGSIGLGVHADAFAEGPDFYNEAHGLALGIAQAQGALSLGGEARTTSHNDGDITADVDSVATANIATSFALGAGSLQAAVGEVAYATLTNDDLVQSDVDATANGTDVGVAIGIGMGAAQLALALDGSDALITNHGTIDLDVTADANSDGLASANAMALGGTLQVAGSLVGEAHTSMTNTSLESIDVLGEAFADGAAANADAYVIGAGQVAASIVAARADISNSGAIDAHANAESNGMLGWAEADVAAIDQLVLAVGEVYATVANAEGATIHAEADARGEGFAAIGIAGATAINQYGAAMGLNFDVTNHGTISADADASGFGPLLGPAVSAEAGAMAEARAVVQSPLTADGLVSLENTGDILAHATAEGTSGAGAIAEGHVVRPPTDLMEAALETAGQLLGGGLGLGGGMMGPGSGGAPGLGYILVGQDPGFFNGLGGNSGNFLGGNAGPNSIDPALIIAQMGSTIGDLDKWSMDVNVAVHNAATGRIAASANADSGARGVGAWYQAGGVVDVYPGMDQDAPYNDEIYFAGNLSGLIANEGVISGSAIASDVYGSAEAFGVVEVSNGYNTTHLTNSGTIRAYAEGAEPSATGIAVASLVDNKVAPADVCTPDTCPIEPTEPDEPQTTVTNNGGLIWAAIKNTNEPVLGAVGEPEIRRGNAINTRGNITNIRVYPQDFAPVAPAGAGFAPVIVEVDELTAAPNEVIVNLKGGLADSHGKEHALSVISHELKSAYGHEDAMGFIYGDIQLTADDEINVTDGIMMFDGVINNPDKPEPQEVMFSDSKLLSELTIDNGGTLVMLQNKNEGASRGYVHELNIGNNGEDYPDRTFSDGTLAYELTDSNAEGDYSQIFADEADIENGKFHAIFRAGHYADLTVYDNIIDAEDLYGEFASVTDNSLLLKTRAAYEYGDEPGNDGQNVDLVVERTDFNAVAGLTDNQKAAGGAIEKVYDGVDPSTPFGKLVASLFTVDSQADYEDILDQLAGAEYAQNLQSVLWSTRGLNRVITDRMSGAGSTGGAGGSQTAAADIGGGASVMPTADAPMASSGGFEAGRGSVWMSGYGQWTALSGDDEAPGLDENQYGVLFGADYAFDDNWFAGLAGGYFSSNGNLDDWGDRTGSSVNYDGLQVAAYGGYDNSVYYVRGVLAYGNYQGDSQREIDTTGLVQGLGTHGQLTGDLASDVFSFYGETGYRFAIADSASLTPYLGLNLATATLDGFTEDDGDGTGAALEVHDSDADSVASVVGLRLNGDMAAGSGVFTPALSVAWMHEFGDTAQSVNMSFADVSGSTFSSTGSEVARDSVLVDAGATFSMDDTFDLGLYYNGQFNEDYSANAVSARLGYKF